MVASINDLHMNGWDSKCSVHTFDLNAGVRCGGRSLLPPLLQPVLLYQYIFFKNYFYSNITTAAIAAEDGRQHQ